MVTDVSTLKFHGRDEFRRELVAEKVIKLLTSDIEVSPLVIDGDWGTGKTEFCHKLINKFRESHEGYRLLYVDAFHADHADNPLMTVLSAVLTLLPDEKQKNNLIKKALPVLRYGLATTGKALVSHLLKRSADDIADGFEEHLQDTADKLIDSSVRTLLKDHENSQENLNALQSTLESIAKNNPIVIFIDELDRCRPDFSVQMLEVVKHTFNVEGVKFVLVTNIRQLRAAINHCYGSLVDSQRYLDKFLKFSFRLPEFIVDDSINNEYRSLAAVEHLINLIKNSSVLGNSHLSQKQNGTYAFIKELVEINSLSLRDVETFVRHMEIYQRLTKSSASVFGYQLLEIFSVYLFCFASDVTDSIWKNQSDAHGIAALLGLNNINEIQENFYHCSHTYAIALILAENTTLNKDQYTVSPARHEEWEFLKKDYFGGWNSRNTNKLDVVKRMLITLRLGGI